MSRVNRKPSTGIPGLSRRNPRTKRTLDSSSAMLVRLASTPGTVSSSCTKLTYRSNRKYLLNSFARQFEGRVLFVKTKRKRNF